MVVAIQIVLASLILSHLARADEPLRASLDYTIPGQPYVNSVEITMMRPDTRITVDRDPSSPYYGTIYAGFSLTTNATVIDPETSGSFTIKRSLDGGRTFDGPFVFDVCSSIMSCWFEWPDIAVGNHGVVYIARQTKILRSVDQGLSWKTVAFFGDHGSVSVSTDTATGAVYVAHVNASGALRVTRSVDEGQTWSSPVGVSASSTGATPHVAAFRDNVVVAFLSAAEGPCYPSCAYVTVAASHDGGVTWPSIAAVSPPDVAGWSAPSVAVSPDGIFAVSWSLAAASATVGTMATFVSISHDNGNSFSAPIEVSRYPGISALGFGDALVFDDRSRLYVTWHSFGSEPEFGGSVYVGISTNLGQDFTSASFRINIEGGGANGSSYEHLAAGPDGRVYLTWFDGRENGAFFRSVSGEASGDVVPTLQLAPSAAVDIELVDPATTTVQARATWTGSPLVLAELPPNIYDVWVRIGNASARAGAMPVRTWNTTAFTVHVEGGPSGPGTPPFPWITAAAGGIVLFATAALLALQHTRLAREEILQRKVRLLIYETVREHPGSSFTEVRDAIGLQNGVAAYHLSVLEKQGLVHSEKGRRHRWYYPNGDVSLWRDRPLSPLQRALLVKVGQAPGIGIRELARTLNRRHGSVGYNVKGLVREGLLRTQRTGRKVQCFPTDESGTA